MNSNLNFRAIFKELEGDQPDLNEVFALCDPSFNLMRRKASQAPFM